MTSIEKAIEKVTAKRQQDLTDLQDVVEAPQEPFVPEPEPESDTIQAMAEAQYRETDQGEVHQREATVARYSRDTRPTQSEANNRVATFDIEQARSLGMLIPDETEGSIAEEFRRIKRPLINNAFGVNSALVENGNLIMVTSAIPAEGKTFVSVSLAISIAMELDKTVLLVDADVTKESATKLFKETKDPGLLDVIVQSEVRLEDVIVSTDIPKLSLLPAGQLRGRATELLASDSMRQIVQELASRYDDRVVVFDSPPLLVTSEAGVLASLMGQIVMVVEAEKTTQKRVAEAMALLDQNKPIGMVLNKSRTAERGGYYYGYYGYNS